MELKRLFSIIGELEKSERHDLARFLGYRQIPSHLIQKTVDGTGPDSQVGNKRSFASQKSKLEAAIVEWFVLNKDLWISDQLFHLIRSHLYLVWGDAKKANRMAEQVKQKAIDDGRVSVARLCIEIQSAASQAAFPENASDMLRKYVRESAELLKSSVIQSEVNTLYVEAATLAEQNMLPRTPKLVEAIRQLQKRVAEIENNYQDLSPNLWVYHVQTKAHLHMVKGEFVDAFNCLNLLWKKMTAGPNAIPPNDHRFYQFFQTYTSIALKAEQWQDVLEATDLYKKTITTEYGNDPKKFALADLFFILGSIGLREKEAEKAELIAPVLRSFADKTKTEYASYDLSEWDLHVSVDILPILISHAFEQKNFDVCNKLLSNTIAFKLKKSNIATDILNVRPLIDQVIQFEKEQQTKKSMPSSDFIRGSEQCYEIYRRKKDTHPIEWEMARLFRTLAHNNKKKPGHLFQKTHERLLILKTNLPYFGGLMNIFNFEKWLSSKLLTS